jgi:hypothetical protein
MPHVARLSMASIRQLRWQYGCVLEDMDRLLTHIDVADLLRLAALAADAEAELFERNPRGSKRPLHRHPRGGPGHGLLSGRPGRMFMRFCGWATVRIWPR